MRTGGYIASSPEIGIINLICLEMSRFYGLPTQATGMSADAKAANFQAGSEGGMTALAAVLAGADSLIAAGGLDGVQVSSYAKYVLDNDQIGALRRYLREDAIDETSALMDDIVAVGIGGHFLGRRHPRPRAHRGVAAGSVPARYLRGVRGRPLAHEAAALARDILATHEVPPLPEDADRHIDEVVAGWAARTA